VFKNAIPRRDTIIGAASRTRTQQRTSRLISITHFWNRRDQEDQEKPKDEDRRQSAVSSKSEARTLVLNKSTSIFWISRFEGEKQPKARLVLYLERQLMTS
ncbi:unnamed protein product, partial [Acanthoscelides obtectus]